MLFPMTGDKTSARRIDRRPHIGRLGEDLAAGYVQRLGWHVLDRNWRTRAGELDIIADAGDTLVVVEVKTRATRSFGDPVAAVTPAKLARMRRLAGDWLSGQDRHWREIRFDVISVELDQRDPDDLARAGIIHHRDVWA